MTTRLSGDARVPAALGMNEDDHARVHRRWFAVRHGEPATTATLGGTGRWLQMARDGTCRVTDVGSFLVHCGDGTLWVTSPDYPGDTVVAAGEQLNLTSRGTIMVAAIGASSMWVPEGIAVDVTEGATTRRMELRKHRDGAALQQAPPPHGGDKPRRPRSELATHTAFGKFIEMWRGRLPRTD